MLATSEGAADYPFLLARGDEIYLSWNTETGLPIDPYSLNMVLRFFALLLTLISAPAFAAVPHLFFPSSLEQIRTQRLGPFLLVLWSLDCPACRQELKLLGETLKANPKLDLVLVATDDQARAEEVEALLARYGLDSAESWIFGSADTARLRYAIDPGWYGELPRAYFYLPDGQRIGHSGPLGTEQIEAWLKFLQKPQ
ncbi:MAG: TlpA family protein disulfide reductase [Methylohalobius sp.]